MRKTVCDICETDLLGDMSQIYLLGKHHREGFGQIVTMAQFYGNTKLDVCKACRIEIIYNTIDFGERGERE